MTFDNISNKVKKVGVLTSYLVFESTQKWFNLSLATRTKGCYFIVALESLDQSKLSIPILCLELLGPKRETRGSTRSQFLLYFFIKVFII